MNLNRLMARLPAAALCASVVPVLVLGGAAASVGEPGGSATYNCQGERSSKASPTPVEFALIGPPSSVRPGDTLSLSGTLDITLSDANARQSKLELATKANVIATDFRVMVTVAGKSSELKPSVVTSSPEPIKNPWTMSADVAFPDITIPASATGRITLRMPLAKTAPTTVVGTPEEVTFNAEVAQDSPLLGSRKFACWADELGDDATIARIPVATTTGPSPDPTESPASTDEQAPDTGATGAAPPSAGGAPAPLPDVPSIPVEAPAPPAADTTATAAADAATAPASDATALVNAEIPPETASSETFIPGWILVLFIAIFPVAAVAVAVLQRRRLQALLFPTTTSA